MNPIGQMVSAAMTNITGMAIDLTTVVVGIIVIVVLLAGLDLILLSLGIDSHSFVSSNKGKIKSKKEFSVKDNEEKYKQYACDRYWKEQYKDRYEREFK